MKKYKSDDSILSELINAGLTKVESLAILHSLNQKNGSHKPDYNIRIVKPSEVSKDGR